MHVILMNKSGRNKAIVLTTRFYFVRIHHELSKHIWSVKGHHTDEHCDANDSIGYKKHVSYICLEDDYERL